MISNLAERLIVKHDGDTVTVSLRPDWRGMNAHLLGVWHFPLNASDRARLEELGVPADMIT